MHTFWLLLLAAGATARLTRISTSDTITDTFRLWVGNVTKGRIRLYSLDDPHEWRWTLLSCPWCIGFWLSIAVTYLAYISDGHDWFVLPATALTISYTVGYIAGYEK